jgi:hypothetical protein
MGMSSTKKAKIPNKGMSSVKKAKIPRKSNVTVTKRDVVSRLESSSKAARQL